jgi:hypothetical protein
MHGNIINSSDENFKKYMEDSQRTDYIKIQDCKHSYLYKINSRNLDPGVFNEKTKGFIGIREKFGQKYLFTEFYHDIGAPYGTVKPLEEICKIPSDIKIDEYESHELGREWAVNPDTEQLEAVFRRDFHSDEKQHGKRQGFTDQWVKNKQRLPDNLYPHLRGNKELFEFLKQYEK